MPNISRFNHIRKWRDGHYLAFNAASGAMGLLSEENFTCYEHISASMCDNKPHEWSEQEQTLINQLKFGGFVTDHKDSDFEQLKFRCRQHRYDPRSLGLVVAPTMACNMGCAYCFESNKHGRMSPKVVEGLIEFVEKRAPILEDFQKIGRAHV